MREPWKDQENPRLIQAGTEAGIATRTDRVRAAEESPLGLRDKKAPEIKQIQPEGDTMETLESTTGEAVPTAGAKGSQELRHHEFQGTN